MDIKYEKRDPLMKLRVDRAAWYRVANNDMVVSTALYQSFLKAGWVTIDWKLRVEEDGDLLGWVYGDYERGWKWTAKRPRRPSGETKSLEEAMRAVEEYWKEGGL